MQISCPKCANSYTLDDRLLPPGGAPVQCTRCGLVFTATPGAPSAQAREAPAQSAGRQTQVFGATAAPAASAARSTQVFGAVPAIPSPERPAPAPAPAHRHTQVFGAAPAQLAAPSPRHTQVFGSAGQPAPSLGQTVKPPPQVHTTQLFGQVASAAPAQLNALGDPSLSPNRTQIFGKTVPPASLSPELSLTQELAILDANDTLNLPPEPNPLRGLDEPADEAVEFIQRTQARSRRRWLQTVLLLLLLGGGGAGAYYWLGHAQPLPPEVVTAKEASFDLLRRDDSRSRARASEQLKRLVEAHPESVEIRADDVLALALELDELKLRLQHLKVESEQLNHAITYLQDHQTPSDWAARVEDHRHTLDQLKTQSDPLTSQAEALDGEMNSSFKQLTDAMGGQTLVPLGVVRAEAVYFGVRGADQTIALAERYRHAGGQDGWDAVAFAEYALNAHVAPDTQREALAGIESLKMRDSGLLRAYLLAARLKHELKDTAGAAQELEAAAALNPHHETAHDLLAWQRERL